MKNKYYVCRKPIKGLTKEEVDSLPWIEVEQETFESLGLVEVEPTKKENNHGN